MSGEAPKVQCFLGREEIESKREITDGATTDTCLVGSSKHGLTSSCALALRLSLESKATSRALSLFLLPGLCQVSLAPCLLLLIQNLGKCFLPVRGSWSVLRRRILRLVWLTRVWLPQKLMLRFHVGRCWVLGGDAFTFFSGDWSEGAGPVTMTVSCYEKVTCSALAFCCVLLAAPRVPFAV